MRTPKSLRLHIGIFGRTNVGKSSFLNMLAGQEVSIVSSVPGTTTDVVEKSMELLPVGPVVFLDTAGIDDVSELAKARIDRTEKVFRRAEVAVLISEPGRWGNYEEGIVQKAHELKLPLILVINKCDLSTDAPDPDQLELLDKASKLQMFCSAVKPQRQYVDTFRELLVRAVPEEFLQPMPLVGDLVPSGGHAVFIVPIDLQAPKGRLILPQVQAIRDMLDADATVSVVKEREYASFLQNLKKKPDLVVCDSQVVQKMVADTPDDIPCTTFSTLFARFKGDLIEEVKGVKALDSLKKGDRILIGEACSHHALEDDIGRIKIPRWIRQYLGEDIPIEVYSGRDYPEDLSSYKLVVHCGACMLNRREMLIRIEEAKRAGIAITNYGICISHVQGVLERILSPFPAAKFVLKHDITLRSLT